MRFRDVEGEKWAQRLQSLFTKSEHSPINLGRSFTELEAQMWLLAYAECAERRIKGVEVKPGQLLTSEGALAQAWWWYPMRVHRFLVGLEKDGWIERRTSKRGTLITIYAIYDEYKDEWGEKEDSEQGDKTPVFKPNFDSKKINSRLGDIKIPSIFLSALRRLGAMYQK